MFNKINLLFSFLILTFICSMICLSNADYVQSYSIDYDSTTETSDIILKGNFNVSSSTNTADNYVLLCSSTNYPITLYNGDLKINTTSYGITFADGSKQITAGVGSATDVLSSTGTVVIGSDTDASGDENIYFQTLGATNRVVIDGLTGNVGISTMTPSEKLDILGNINCNGNIVSSGTISSSGNIVSSGTISSTYGVSSSTGVFSSSITASNLTITGDNKVWQRIKYETLVASATSISITNLTGDTDIIYNVKVHIVSGENTSRNVFIQFNTDTTAIYAYQTGSNASTSFAAVSSTTANGIFINNLQAISQLGFSDIQIFAKSGYNRLVLVRGITDSASESSIGADMTCSGIWGNSADEITSIQIVSDTTNGLGIGTNIEVYTRR